jgi:glycosyltransferase involved in cell wall biosynthesis
MKVLLSAYACRPNQGSEPGIGWNWALEIARLGHDVWVLTHEDNCEYIEKELARKPSIRNLKFIYYDLPPWAVWWAKDNRAMRFHYLLWQWGVYFLAKKIHQDEQFDRVQHITFGSIRQPSLLGNLGIPFIFGPVAGGERAPWCLRKGYGFRGWVTDWLRDLSNILTRVDPFVRRTFKQAERIIVTSEQTRSLVPHKFRKKVFVQLAIGLNTNGQNRPVTTSLDSVHNKCLKILFIGRVLYWKGMHLGVPAFADLLKRIPSARMTLVGKGPDEKRLRTLANNLGIEEKIDWIPWLDRKELPAIYADHDVFLFPSLGYWITCGMPEPRGARKNRR